MYHNPVSAVRYLAETMHGRSAPGRRRRSMRRMAAPVSAIRIVLIAIAAPKLAEPAAS